MRLATVAGALLLFTSNAAIAAPCDLNVGTTIAQARAGLCGFDVARRQFRGTPREQAACLLRTVGRGRNIGASNVPPGLLDIVATELPFTRDDVAAYLRRQAVAPAEVGGDLGRFIRADYFVIHDTSIPNCSEADQCSVRGAFPPDINADSFAANRSFHGRVVDGRFVPGRRRAVAHVMTNRTGRSITEVDLSDHISHVKFDYCHDSGAKRQLFVGVENIQPRIGIPAVPRPGRSANDLQAPTPGFTEAQYRRLALVYVSASARRGRWLIPAFHGVVDGQYSGGHDDPQNFDLVSFERQLRAVMAEIGSSS